MNKTQFNKYYTMNDSLTRWSKDACKRLIKESKKYGIKIKLTKDTKRCPYALAYPDEKLVEINKKQYGVDPLEDMFTLIHEIGHIIGDKGNCCTTHREMMATMIGIRFARDIGIKNMHSIRISRMILRTWDFYGDFSSKGECKIMNEFYKKEKK